MLANVVSFPIFVAFILKLPCLLIVAPITTSPILFVTGMLSPVIMLSSTELSPLTINPSTGIFSPGFINKTSPTLTSSIDIFTSLLFLITIAVFGCNPINFFIASDVLPLAIASSHLPRIIKVIITDDVS